MEQLKRAKRYKKYPEYKDSGVEWLGEIPIEWDSIQFRRITNLQQGLQIAQSDRYSEYKDGLVEYITIKSIHAGENRAHKEYINNPSARVQCNYDDVLLARTGATGEVVTNIEGVFHNNFFKVNYLKDKIIKDFLVYLLSVKELKNHLLMLAGTTTIPDLNHGSFLGTYIPSLSKVEQIKISDFLDYETSKIDILIEKQEKLIVLLKEKRQAVISHAVTKGLNPNVPMKDSGVEWLGEVPEHWDVSQLRYNLKFSKGLSITKENLIDFGIPCVNYGEVHSKVPFDVDPLRDTLKAVPESYSKQYKNCLLDKGDIIFADTSEDIEGSGNFTQLNGQNPVFAGYHTIIARPNITEGRRFYAYVFDSVQFRTQIRTKVKGVKVFSITQAILKNILVWLAPDAERNEIVQYLDNKIHKIDKIIVKTEKQISLLKEKRTSLISAAVTGKIDVRDLVKAGGKK